MKLKKIIVFILILSVVFIGCGKKENTDTSTTATKKKDSSTETNQSANSKTTANKTDFNAQFELPKAGDTVAIIHIKNYGDIKMKFFKEVAPKAVENFITHSKNGYYNGVTFHRIVKDFVIQGGDPTGTGAGGESIWGKAFEDEYPPIQNPTPYPFNGAVAMANAGANTNGSQFFIVNAPTSDNVLEQLKAGGYPDELINMYKEHGGTPHLFYRHTVFGQVYEGMDVVEKIMNSENNTSSGSVIIENIEIVEYK